MEPPPDFDYYEILQVDPTATPDEITTNYRKLAKLYHPDSATPSSDEAVFKKIERAFSVLIDPIERERYDSIRRSSSGDPGRGAGSPSAPFGEHIGASFPSVDPAEVDFGTVSVGHQSAVHFVSILTNNGWPTDLSENLLDKEYGRFWETSGPQQRSPDDPLYDPEEFCYLKLTADLPPDMPPGRHTDTLSVTWDGSSATVRLTVRAADGTMADDAANDDDVADGSRASSGVGSSYVPTPRPRSRAPIGAAAIGLVLIIIFALTAYSVAHRAPRPPLGTLPSTTSDPSTTLPASVSPSYDFSPVFIPGSLNQGSNYTNGGSESLYSASVSVISGQQHTVTVSFSAQGQDDLDDPSETCVMVNANAGSTGTNQFPYLLYPISINLTVNQPGSYVGTLVFPMMLPGSYNFEYGCDSGYQPLIYLGSATHIPLVGISNGPTAGNDGDVRYFASVYEVRRSPNETVVLYSSSGADDLVAPNQACILDAEGSVIDSTPAVNNVWEASTTSADSSQAAFVGTLIFPIEAPPGSTFSYACNTGVYGTVPLFTAG